MSLHNIYKGKKVLVCGASGLSGYHIAKHMLSLGAKVVGTYYSSKPQIKTVTAQVDFTDKAQTNRFFYEFAPFDYVFICCAKTYNAFVCATDPASMILPNIVMLSNILEYCLKTSSRRVVYMSSAVVYQPFNKPLSEDDIDWNLDPHDIYMGVGWVKRYAEKLCAFYNQQGLSVACVRPTNIYGPNDKIDLATCHVIPALVSKALRGDTPYLVSGSGRPVKDFLYAPDLARDIALVAADIQAQYPVNLCSGSLVSISDLAHLILKLTKHKADIQFEGSKDAVPYRALDNSRFKMMFGKQTYTPLERGLKEVIKWYSSLRLIPNR